ncbi:FG-GAP repeat domain-containing protein [Cellvibrio sp.]|uniref:FG-GAP repeat domain-containing protein n=1 Tax=Cellvibrio sp. TaxID=1965322 RepID=UPI0039648961
MHSVYKNKQCLVLLGLLVASVSAANQPKDVQTVVALTNKHCGMCHSVPSPSLLPKNDWPSVIKIMVGFAREKMGKDFISDDDATDIAALYYGSSPAELPRLPYNDDASEKLKFSAREFGEKSNIPLIVNIKSVNLNNKREQQLLVCDAENKKLSLLSGSDKKWVETKLADIEVPIFTDVVDYDGDGDLDIIVTDLGDFPPSKKLVGRVFLLKQTKAGVFEKETLVEGIPRATQARALDVDGDGDLDLVVAAFGGNNVGEIFWLENAGGGKQLKHSMLELSGALNVTPTDLNADGKMDFVSLVSQEHEMLVAFLAKGKGEFETRVLARAPHPMYGSTGMTLVDMDKDGDEDILFTNGDAFDTQFDPKPYHGVQWLENKGNLSFEYHEIGRSYGIANAAAYDIDGDGDRDVIAASFINYWEDEKRKSLVWFENDGHQHFTQHNFVSTPPGVVSFEIKDFTGDGRPDILAATFRMDLLELLMSHDAKKIESIQKGAPSNTRFILLKNEMPKQNN